MFAYCGNNPVNYSDPSGNRFTSTSSQIKACYYLAPGQRGTELAQLQTDADGVAFDFGFRTLQPYNGVQVIEVPFLNDNAFSFGAIFIGDKVSSNQRLLSHEYGHFVQLEEVGLRKYFIFVAIPSITFWALTELGFYSYEVYYDRPWECIADMYGGVNRKHAAGVELAAEEYWSFVISYEHPEIPMS